MALQFKGASIYCVDCCMLHVFEKWMLGTPAVYASRAATKQEASSNHIILSTLLAGYSTGSCFMLSHESLQQNAAYRILILLVQNELARIWSVFAPHIDVCGVRTLAVTAVCGLTFLDFSKFADTQVPTSIAVIHESTA